MPSPLTKQWQSSRLKPALETEGLLHGSDLSASISPAMVTSLFRRLFVACIVFFTITYKLWC